MILASADKDTKTSTEDTAKIYKVAQAVIKKLEDYSEDDAIEIKEDEVKDCKDVYLLVLNTVQTQVEDKVDNLTKDIAYLDLNSANGVEDILTKANLIEGLRELEKGVQDALKQLTPLIKPEELEQTSIDPGLKNDIKFQVDNFMAKAQNTILDKISLAPDLEPSDIKIQGYQDLALIQDLKELKVQSYEEVTTENDIETIVSQESMESSPVLHQEASPITEKLEAQIKEPEILAPEASGQESATAHHGDSSAHDQFGAGFASPTQINLVSSEKANVKFETVNINDLSNYLQDQIHEVPQNKSQEIRLQITPDSVGKIDLVITKNERNEVTVQMSFHSREGMDTIKQDLKNTIAELREVLKAKDLDLSKFEVKESSSSRTSYDGSGSTTSFNQAREEQKHKLQNAIPEWVKQKESTTQVSFKQIIEGI
jgi:hypothetical protein